MEQESEKERMPTGSDPRSERLRSLARFHADVDARAAELAARHASRLQCRRGCSACCQDELSVTRVEADLIRAVHGELLAEGEPGPAGGCAFLDADGACRIYHERPLVCRTQGLPLRVFLEDESEEIVEKRDICPLNVEGGPPLASLESEDCWLVGPDELRLVSMNDAHCGEDSRRVLLRALFRRPSC